MARINEILRKLVRERGSNKEVSEPLGITPQALGNYMKERKIPLEVVTKWKEVYGDDLIKLSGAKSETNVSRETKDSKIDESCLPYNPTAKLISNLETRIGE